MNIEIKTWLHPDEREELKTYPNKEDFYIELAFERKASIKITKINFKEKDCFQVKGKQWSNRK